MCVILCSDNADDEHNSHQGEDINIVTEDSEEKSSQLIGHEIPTNQSQDTICIV